MFNRLIERNLFYCSFEGFDHEFSNRVLRNNEKFILKNSWKFSRLFGFHRVTAFFLFERDLFLFSISTWDDWTISIHIWPFSRHLIVALWNDYPGQKVSPMYEYFSILLFECIDFRCDLIEFLFQTISEHTDLIDSTGSFKNYREAFNSCIGQPCIPYMFANFVQDKLRLSFDIFFSSL